MSQLADLLMELVAIDSVNPSLEPGAKGEAEIACFVARWLSHAGLEVCIEEAAPGRPNVIGILHGTGGGSTLMLNAHMDTVGTAGMEYPHSLFMEGNRVYGRGAYDMKGSLAAIMWVASAAKERSWRGDLIIAAVVDEEHASLGTHSLLERWRPDAAIVGEPTELDICIAHTGTIWLEVEIATSDDLRHEHWSTDAVTMMSRVLAHLTAKETAMKADSQHPLLGSGSFQIPLKPGERMLSISPTRCMLTMRRITVPGETPECVEMQVRGILDYLSTIDPSFRANLRITCVRDPFEVSAEEPIVKTLRGQVATLLVHEPRMVGKRSWMDSAILSAAGIPTVVFGPGGGGAHTALEWVDLEQVQLYCEIMLATASEFCG